MSLREYFIVDEVFLICDSRFIYDSTLSGLQTLCTVEAIILIGFLAYSSKYQLTSYILLKCTMNNILNIKYIDI